MEDKVKTITIHKGSSTECYVSNKDYKKLKEKYNNLLASIEVKKEEKELKLYDVVNYCNHEWYVIKIENDEVTLMSKDVIGTCTYSDNNNNDFAESNCIKLLNEFMKKININDLAVLDRNYDEGKFYTGLVGIPTLREIEQMPMNIRECGEAYWTMTSSYGVSEDCDYAFVFRVYSNGGFGWNCVSSAYGVRPVIKVRRESLHE